MTAHDATLLPRDPSAMRVSRMAAKGKVLTRSEARRQADLPVRAKTADLAKMGTLTFLSAEASEARNPQTGEMGPGMIVQVADSDGRKFVAFIGGVALVRELEEMTTAKAFPFTSRIVKDGEGPGHPWTFAD
jgi:hypothetical protein